MYCVLVLLMAVVLCCSCASSSPFEGASTSPFISKGGEVTRKVTESVIK
jgi:hypothetical protein